MAGSAINLGISGGLFGEAPKLGAGMKSLVDGNSARGERVAESGRNAQWANVDLNDPESLTAAATTAQKSGDPVKAKEFFDRATKVRTANNVQIAHETAQGKEAERQALVGQTAQATEGLLTPENIANHKPITDLLEQQQITPAQAQAAMDAANAQSIVTADLLEKEQDEAAEQKVIAGFARDFIANGGTAKLTESWEFGTAQEANKMLTQQLDLNPNSLRSQQKEAIAKNSEVQQLLGAATGMPNIAEARLAMETINNNPMFWPINDEGIAVKGAHAVFTNVSSQYVRAYRSELKEAQIAKDNKIKNAWKPKTKDSLLAAAEMSKELFDPRDGIVSSMWGKAKDTVGYISYDNQKEWIEILAQAIPSVQAGLDKTQVESVDWLKNAMTNGQKGDNTLTMKDLQDHVRATVYTEQMRREGRMPYPTQKPAEEPAATTATPEAEAGADAAMADLL